MKIKAIIRGYVAIELKTANSKYNELKTMLVYKEEIEFEADKNFRIHELMEIRNKEEDKFNAWLYSNSRSVKDIKFENYNSIKMVLFLLVYQWKLITQKIVGLLDSQGH